MQVFLKSHKQEDVPERLSCYRLFEYALIALLCMTFVCALTIDETLLDTSPCLDRCRTPLLLLRPAFPFLLRGKPWWRPILRAPSVEPVSLLVLSRSVRPVAALSGRAKEGLLSRRRRSIRGRRTSVLEQVAVEVVVAIVVGLEVVSVMGGVGVRLAGVEINQRIKGKSIAAEGDVVLDVNTVVEGIATGKPVFKETKIISNGTISCE